MYRWLIALALTVGLGFTVIGCGGGEEPEKGGPLKREKPAKTEAAPAKEAAPAAAPAPPAAAPAPAAPAEKKPAGK